MNEKWIGEEVNTSGSYNLTTCKELKKRYSGQRRSNLYIFCSRFGEEFYISDIDSINEIEKLLNEEKHTELIEYLYKLVIDKFGVIELIVRIGHKIAYERDEGYKAGKERARKEMREVLGL